MASVGKRDNSWECLLAITLGHGIVKASLRLLGQRLKGIRKRIFAHLTSAGRFEVK